AVVMSVAGSVLTAGNTEAQAQTLASTLRGVICQALLPSRQGDAYHLASECLTMTPEFSALITAGNFAGLRTLLDQETLDPSSGTHSMNDELKRLIKQRKVSVDDARRASTDPLNFADVISPN
ncbi:MAG: twitching motility protein, partial [Proteobacteria bacterium]|nr:twitching motility protein [Pseudomonadota bacterium]